MSGPAEFDPVNGDHSIGEETRPKSLEFTQTRTEKIPDAVTIVDKNNRDDKL